MGERVFEQIPGLEPVPQALFRPAPACLGAVVGTGLYAPEQTEQIASQRKAQPWAKLCRPPWPRLLYPHPDSAPHRPPVAGPAPVHPDTLSLAHQAELGDEPDLAEAAVLAVVAVVTHHEVVSFRHLVGAAPAKYAAGVQNIVRPIAELLAREPAVSPTSWTRTLTGLNGEKHS